ncbi:hypothetical protein PMI42_06236 [Bradyrhizobium sp. YR681]|nr:hypothetical protein [Bradyrhizobium sp. YR681]EJN10460.1 hypothetical protein PMI42_06236 [Bradyrhizobium sp. YR681]
MFEIIGRIVVYGTIALGAVAGAAALWTLAELLMFSDGTTIRSSIGG